MAYELEKIESEFEKIWKAIEELQMTRQAKDEFRAEIWKAIEELQNQDKTPLSFANDINPCPPCDCGGITRLTEKVMEKGDYKDLYEKERERWKKLKAELLKMKGACRELDFSSQNNEAREIPETKRFLLNVVLQKMQELEAE